jgi:hypothetical protein
VRGEVLVKLIIVQIWEWYCVTYLSSIAGFSMLSKELENVPE